MTSLFATRYALWISHEQTTNRLQQAAPAEWPLLPCDQRRRRQAGVHLRDDLASRRRHYRRHRRHRGARRAAATLPPATSYAILYRRKRWQMAKARNGDQPRTKAGAESAKPMSGAAGFREEATPFVATLIDPSGVVAVDRVADAFS